MPPTTLSAWIAELASVWPDLSLPQIRVLAQYSLGMMLAEGSGLARVSFCLSQWLQQPFNTVRERLRDFYCSRQDKTGRRRRELDVAACFPGLLGWVLRHWNSNELAIAMDATTLGQRFVALVLSVVYAGTAIPVAWKITKADAKGAWKPHWLRLLRDFKQIVPWHMKVIVLADRGLYARWLFRGIVELGWHPYLRVNAAGGQFKADDTTEYRPLTSLVAGPGQTYCCRGTLFRSAPTRLNCTLTACWAQGCAEPWIIATELPPEQAKATWYGLRNWIERGFKHDKSGGMRWQYTRMSDPRRAERLWLVMAIARFMAVRGGSQYHARGAASDRPQPIAACPTANPMAAGRNPLLTGKNPRPVLSIFMTGLLLCRMMIQMDQPVPTGNLTPTAWPDTLPTHISRSDVLPP